VQDSAYSSHEVVYCDKWMAHPSELLTVVAVCDKMKSHCACTKRFHCLHIVAANSKGLSLRAEFFPGLGPCFKRGK